MSYTLKQHLEYNHWANGKIADFLLKADENIFDAEVKSSFPSLRKTVYHIWDAEILWFQRLNGESLLKWPSDNFTGTKEEALKAFVAHSAQFAQFIASKDASYYESIVTYKNTSGIEYKTAVDGIIMHVVNHGCFHRGQIVTMLRTLGFTELSSTDLIIYLRL
jgi:uncharacterized damage-inducible protein DinB